MLANTRGTILYIEDNFLNMEIVKRIINLMGYDLVEAFDGRTGMQIAKEIQPDMILLDMNLPDQHGADVITVLRNAHGPDLPIVVLTADSLTSTYRRCVEAGADGYLTKPISRPLLMKTVQQFLPDDTVYKAI